jgi:hypothetical protein
MQKLGISEAALQMLDRFGANAELEAGDEMDRALEQEDADDFDRWRSIAVAIAALNRQCPTIRAAQDQLKEPVFLVRAGRDLAPG